MFFNDNNKEDINQQQKINNNEDNEDDYEENEIIEKLDEMNINKGNFKNNVDYKNFEDEDLIFTKKKSKINSEGEMKKLKNMIKFIIL